MRVTISLLIQLIFLLTFGYSYGQSSNYCGFDQNLAHRLKTEPNLAQKLKSIQTEIDQSSSRSMVNGIYYVPIVFHIVTHPSSINSSSQSTDEANMFVDYHGGIPGATTYDRVQDQLNRINTEFSGSNIQFCLAQNAPPSYEGVPGVPGSWQVLNFGGSTYTSVGVTYNSDATLSTFQSSNTTVVNNMENILPFNQPGENLYLDIYVVDDVVNALGASIKGEASFGLGANFDDITVVKEGFGDVTVNGLYSLDPGIDQGKVAVHEVGHWLFLKHVFTPDQLCDPVANAGLNGDFVTDTPPQNDEGQNLLSGSCGQVNACGGTIILNNHMDYLNDACKVSSSGVSPFTPGQTLRMNSFIDFIRADWHSELNRIATGIESGNCSGNSSPSNQFTAEFKMSGFEFCAGENIDLTGMPVGHLNSGSTITGWTFNITSVSPGGSGSVQYNSQGNLPVQATLAMGPNLAPGLYSIELIVNYDINGTAGTKSYTHPQQLEILDCSPSPFRFIKTYNYPSKQLSDLAVVKKSDNYGYIMSGTNHISPTEKEVVVYKTDLMGTILWEYIIQNPSDYEIRCFDIIPNKSPGAGQETYLITGYSTMNGEKEAFVIEIQDQGSSCSMNNSVVIPVKTTEMGVPLNHSIGVEIINTSDGGFALVGVVAEGISNVERKKQLIVKLDNQLATQWVHYLNFSQPWDITDYDFANSIVEIPASSYGYSDGYYFIGGSITKQNGNFDKQALSGVFLADNNGSRTIVYPNNSWGPSSTDFDYATDVLYDPSTNRVYQKCFTKKSHGFFINRIDPGTGITDRFFEGNLLHLGLEYVGLKMILSNDGSELVLTGLNSNNPVAFKIEKDNWSTLSNVSMGVLNDIKLRTYDVNAFDFPDAGPEFPVSLLAPMNPSDLHFHYAPKNICRSPNGGYMLVQASGPSCKVNFLKLDEDLITGCSEFVTSSLNTQFTISQTQQLVNDGNINQMEDPLNVNPIQASIGYCDGVCFEDFEIKACHISGGNANFDLNAGMQDFTALGNSITWTTDEQGNQVISNPASFISANNTVIYAQITTSSGCLATSEVTLIVNYGPQMNNLALNSPTGVFDLITAQIQIGALGLSYSWFEDENLSIPISAGSLSAYTGVSGQTVYVQGTDYLGCTNTAKVKLCNSQPISFPVQSTGLYQEQIWDMVTDDIGHVYITGYYTTQMSLLGTTASNTNASYRNFFVAKFSECGLEWLHVNDDQTRSEGTGIAIDHDGSVYVCGGFDSTLNISGSTIVPFAGQDLNKRTFVAKFASNGNLLWLQQSGDGPHKQETRLNDIAIYESGSSTSVYVTGVYHGHNGHHGDNLLLVKHKGSNGNLEWFEGNFSHKENTAGIALDVMPNGHLMIAGMAYGSNQVSLIGHFAAFNPNNQQLGYIFEFDENNTYVTNFVTNNYQLEDLKIDGNLNVIVTGSIINHPFVFGGQAASSNAKVITAQYSPQFSEHWCGYGTSTGPTQYNHPTGYSLTLDQNDDIFVTGQFCENMTFGSISTMNSTSSIPNNMNMFVVKYSTNGQEEWGIHKYSGFQSNTPLREQNVSICSNQQGEAFIGGYFNTNVSFGGSLLVPTAASGNFYVAEVQDYGTFGAFKTEVGPEKEQKLEDKILKEHSEANYVTIYPNPSRDNFTIEIKLDNETIQSAKVYNLQGKVIQRLNPKDLIHGSYSFDCSQMANGMYYLVISTSHERYQKKLIISK
jgi:hypothetical protein